MQGAVPEETEGEDVFGALRRLKFQGRFFALGDSAYIVSDGSLDDIQNNREFQQWLNCLFRASEPIAVAGDEFLHGLTSLDLSLTVRDD